MEKRNGEPVVFAFDRTTTSTILGADLDRDDPQSFNPGRMVEVIRDTQRVAARVEEQGRTEPAGLPVIDAARAPGRRPFPGGFAGPGLSRF
jgi:hypothetical protein